MKNKSSYSDVVVYSIAVDALFDAVGNGSVKGVKRILRDVRETSGEGFLRRVAESRDPFTGLMPLHVACGRRNMSGANKTELLRVLADSYPPALSRRDCDDGGGGSLPVHIVCRNPTRDFSTAPLEYLAGRNPDSLDATDRAGRNAMHFACSSDPPAADAIKFILSRRPDSLTSADGEGRTPVHAACLNDGCSPEIIELLGNACPRALRLPDRRLRQLPLHKSVQRDLDPSVVRFLLEKHPGAAKVRDVRGRLPLHIACYRSFLCGNKNNNGNGNGGQGGNHQDLLLPVVKLLVPCHPESIRETDDRGQTPVHIISSSRSSSASTVVPFLVKRDRDVTSVRDGGGRIPLHVFLSRKQHPNNRKDDNDDNNNNASSSVPDDDDDDFISILMPESRDSLRSSRDGDGRNCLHAAAERPSACAVEAILRRDPSMASDLDNDGMTPLHLACARNDDDDDDVLLRVIQTLLDSHPAAGLARDKKTGRTPLHILCDKTNRVEGGGFGKSYLLCRVARKLVLECPGSVVVKDDRGRTPLVTALLRFASSPEAGAAGESDVQRRRRERNSLSLVYRLIRCDPSQLNWLPPDLEQIRMLKSKN